MRRHQALEAALDASGHLPDAIGLLIRRQYRDASEVLRVAAEAVETARRACAQHADDAGDPL